MRSPSEGRDRKDLISFDWDRFAALLEDVKCSVCPAEINNQRRELASPCFCAVNAVAIDLFVQRMARGWLKSQAHEEFRRAGKREHARYAPPLGALQRC